MRIQDGGINISYESESWHFEPSFKNIAKICDPDEFACFYAAINGEHEKKASVAESLNMSDCADYYFDELHRMASVVMQSCCKKDCSRLTGYLEEIDGVPIFSDGIATRESCLTIARSLLNSGLIGCANSSSKSSSDKTSDIDVYDFVYIAISHLDMPKSEAESLSKIEFDRIVEAKYPKQDKKEKTITAEKHAQNMAAARLINERIKHG